MDITIKQNCVNLLKNSMERNIKLCMHVLLVHQEYFERNCVWDQVKTMWKFQFRVKSGFFCSYASVLFFSD